MSDMSPFFAKVDLLGMAEHGVLKISPQMVWPRDRNLLAAGAEMGVAAVNTNMLPPDRAPKSWEDFLKPELKGKKFIVDIRPKHVGSLVKAKGLDWVVDYSKKIAAQDPVWARGDTQALAKMAAGEQALHLAANYHTTIRTKEKAPFIEPLIFEPVPVRSATLQSIAKTTKHPYASMLFLEYLAGPEGQKLLDEMEPLKGALHFPTSALAQAAKGRAVSLLEWEDLEKQGEYHEAIIKAYGLPRAEIQ